ncbi:MAG TPA: hypothetical protein VMY37_07810 [Thermoguttaceae bacterium]|nr:hypothetical protein [Thermoguttaceae bacterium]
MAGADVPDDRVIDGLDILPLLTSDAASPHEALFSMTGPNLMTVRSGRWKLHVKPPPKWPKHLTSGWVDPRGPDGVTILAPYEQATPDDHPDVLTGDPAEPMMLFDLEEDRCEQHNVANEHPDVVQRLKALFDQMAAQVPPPPQAKKKTQ